MEDNYYGNQKQNQQQREQIRYKEKDQQLNKESYRSKQAQSSGNICNNCGYNNEPNAKFCAECGANLSGALNCPNCGSNVSLEADICEACGTWLLEGKCCFCYAELSGNEKFCPECGNPTDGIICPNCGTHNIFDFCKKCNNPLTEAAHEELKKINENPYFQSLIKLGEELDYLADDNINEAELQKQIAEAEKQMAIEKQKFEEAAKKEEQIQMMMRLEQYANKNSQGKRQEENKKPSEPPKQFISDTHLKAIERAKQTLQNAEQRKNDRINKERQLQQELNKMAQLTFETSQEARRFFNAVKPRLYPAKPKYWLCNYANYQHPDGPAGCAEPKLGGYWIYD
ncbi:MAG TPA: zinc ribbon domain-containing protein [Melioribacteraceae bacterium]|nr:zinc ribbon domain-containing protein [Melioribacteraceae bacterium]